MFTSSSSSVPPSSSSHPQFISNSGVQYVYPPSSTSSSIPINPVYSKAAPSSSSSSSSYNPPIIVSSPLNSEFGVSVPLNVYRSNVNNNVYTQTPAINEINKNILLNESLVE